MKYFLKVVKIIVFFIAVLSFTQVMYPAVAQNYNGARCEEAKKYDLPEDYIRKECPPESEYKSEFEIYCITFGYALMIPIGFYLLNLFLNLFRIIPYKIVYYSQRLVYILRTKKAFRAYLPGYTYKQLQEELSTHFIDRLKAWSNYDREALQRICTDEIYQSLCPDLDTLEERKIRSDLSDYDIYESFITSVEKKDSKIVIHATIRAYYASNFKSVTTNKKSFFLNAPNLSYFYVTFVIDEKDVSRTICPNCWKDVEGKKCPSCGMEIAEVYHPFRISDELERKQRV